MRKNLVKKWGLVIFIASSLIACGRGTLNESDTSSIEGEEETINEGSTQSLGEYDLTFKSADLETGYDEETATQIRLSDNNTKVVGDGATVSGSIVTITEGGEYVISGTLSDGQLVVSAEEIEDVHIILDGVDITSQSSAPILITEADKVRITLKEGTENKLTDAEGSTDTIDDSVIDGTIFSKADLALNGSGTLIIEANTNHGIVSKDDLIITSGNYSVISVGQGLSGKDAVKIKEGTFHLTTGKDAIQSDNAEEEGRGYVYIESGTFTINSEGDGIQAETLLQVNDGTFDIVTGGGNENGVDHSDTAGFMGGFSNNNSSADTEGEGTEISTKGLKASSEIIINGGEFVLDTADDSIHSNGDATLSGGIITAESGDDGIHADSNLLLNGSTITILKSYEGIEASTITVDAGTIDVTATDDGFNAAGGNDSSSLNRPGANLFEANMDYQLTFNDGTITVNAQGDGLDSNGLTTINGGEIIISGPENSGNGTLDAGGGTIVNGGTIVGAGSSGMAEGFSSDSEQVNVLYNLENSYSDGALIEVKTSDGTMVLSWTAAKSFSSLLFSSSDLEVGETYIISINGNEMELTLENTTNSNGSGMNIDGMQQPGGGNRPGRFNP